MPDFNSILNKQADEVEAPKPLPPGTYTAIAVRHEFGESQRNKTPYCRFWFKPTEPQEDVDADRYEEFGGAEALTKKEVREDFWLTDDALFRLRNFLEGAAGLDITGQTLAELIPEANNAEVLVEIVHSTSQDGERIFTNIGKIMPVE